MTEKDYKEEDFGEYERLAAILRTTDLSGRSKIRHSLKNRLLSKAAREGRKSFSQWKWLIPVTATALTALALAVNIGRYKEAELPVYYQAPEAGYNIYGNCGRQGLADYLSAPRF